MRMQSSSSVSFDQHQQLISRIYDAALEPNQWETVLKKLSHAFHAEQAYMRIIDTNLNNVQLAYCHNKDIAWTQAYKDYYIHKDPWLNDILKAKKTFVTCTHHLLTDKEYESTEFYYDFVKPQEIHYGLGGRIHLAGNMTT